MIKFSEGTVICNDRVIIENIELSTKINGKNYNVETKNTEISDDAMKMFFECQETGTKAELVLKKQGDSFTMHFMGKIIQKEVYLPIETVDEEEAYTLEMTLKTTDGIFARYMQDTCWTYASFNPYKIPKNTQSLLIKNEDINIAMIPICTKSFKTQLRSDNCNKIKIYMGTESGGYTDIDGYIMSVAANSNPFRCVEKATENCRISEWFNTPSKKEKDTPILMQGLGWCTWDACYFDVTHSKIIEKMEEFKNKGININWVLIDDGWFEFGENRLKSIYADKDKFPGGLSETVHTLKEKYGVKYVGVWHCFNGYWYGIDKNSSAYEDNKEFLTETKAGVIVPDFNDKSKAFAFFDKWHSYLKNEGIDFLKVDCQGVLARFSKYNTANPEAIRNIQEALEESIKKHFDGNVINCMAMGMEHTQSRKYSNLIRNSDDFWPKRPHTFKKHIIQNIYNSVIMNSLYFLDFDMWWTDNEFAVPSAVLRAISGGPIYISDEIGATNANILKPLINEDGSLISCDEAAMPVPSRLYSDNINNNMIVKIMNNCGENSVLALFNAEIEDRKLSADVTYDDIKLKNADEYVVYSYFEKKFYRMTKATRLHFELDKNSAEILNFYPVKDNYIMLGNVNKYISGGCDLKKVSVNELCIDNK